LQFHSWPQHVLYKCYLPEEARHGKTVWARRNARIVHLAAK
jgi:hypothetical protein